MFSSPSMTCSSVEFSECVLLSWTNLKFFSVIKEFTLSQQALVFTCLQYNKSFENTVGKEEIAHNEQFLLFPQCFLPIWRTLLFTSNLKLSSANSLSLEEFKICCLVKNEIKCCRVLAPSCRSHFYYNDNDKGWQ